MKDNFIYWWAGWAIFGIPIFLFFRFSKNVPLKRAVFPISLILTTVVFLYVVWNMMENGGAILYIFSVFAIAIGIANYRSTAFCDSCYAMTYSGVPFKRPVVCSACGSKWL